MVFGSSDEFEEVPRPAMFATGSSLFGRKAEKTEPSRPSRPSKPERRLLTAEGKVPDVVYSVDYVDHRGAKLQTIESLNPYDDVPEYCDEADVGRPELQSPIIRIVTRVVVGSSMLSGQEQPSPFVYTKSVFGQAPGPIANGGDGGHQNTMMIQSEHLKNALTAVIGYYPDCPPSQSGSETVMVQAPYRVLVHHREALAHYKDNQPTWHSNSYAATTARHIDILLDTLHRLVGENLGLEDERLQRKVPMATYDNLWYMMRPGNVVFARNDSDMWAAFVVSSVNMPPKHQPAAINCWSLFYTGTMMQRQMIKFEVSPWMGEQAVHSLPVILAVYFSDALDVDENGESSKHDKEAEKDQAHNGGGVAMLQRHLKLGKLYCELMKTPNYLEYDGKLVNGVNMQFQGPTGFMNGRIICDIQGFHQFANRNVRPHTSFGVGGGSLFGSRAQTQQIPPTDHLPQFKPRCSCDACNARRDEPEPGPFFGFDNVGPTPITDVYYIAMTKIMPAFLIGERNWAHVDLAHVHPIRHDRDAFRQLVLEDHTKRTLRALIGKFSAGTDDGDGDRRLVSPWGSDFVKNKGEGRIFLLHGSPGVGKTCTAECVAELTRRPLLSLTSGDLGVDPLSVERSLSYFLELGQRYGALVLLDEADVYLERRVASDVRRNGLVSVFLRALEYYRGVLFLTTNRVRVFDSAFTSRVHVALHYGDLTDEHRERIWSNAFDRLDRESAGRLHVSVAAREFAYQSAEVRRLKWNGREIRNAMQTALALAESEAEEQEADKITLMDRHLAAVVKMSRGFRDFLAMDADADAVEGGEARDVENDGEGL